MSLAPKSIFVILIAANAFQNSWVEAVTHRQVNLGIQNKLKMERNLRVISRKMALQLVSRSLEKVWVSLMAEMNRWNSNRGYTISMKQTRMLITEANEHPISQQTSTLNDLNANLQVKIQFLNLYQRAKAVANRESWMRATALKIWVLKDGEFQYHFPMMM